MTGPRGRAVSVVALALALALPKATLAHEFTVALAVPLSGPDRAEGQAVLNGFRTATRERDGHADETSEGHLGGLDVQMEPVDSTDAAGLLRAVRDLDAIIAFAAQPETADMLRAALPKTTVVLGPGSSLIPPADFAERYQAEHGQAPDAAARSGYLAARLVDLAVRAEGAADDPVALGAALKAIAASPLD